MDPQQATHLCIVAHPDDEVLWGGGNLSISTQDIRWHVICATNTRSKTRRREFQRCMAELGVWSFEMFGCKDRYTENMQTAMKALVNTPFERALQQYSSWPWKMVLTHNEEGEYGHGMHIALGKMVTDLFPKAKQFQIHATALPSSLLETKVYAMRHYETQAITTQYVQGKQKNLKQVERDYLERETLYVKLPTHASDRFPRIVHQIWIGTKKPEAWRKALMDHTRAICERHGWYYRLWTQEDFKESSFPLSWDTQERLRAFTKREGVNRWAQHADLLRYELLLRYGGVYLDSAFEIRPTLLQTLTQRFQKKATFVGCNEDPCALTCTGWKAHGYLSNGFFACIPGHPAMRYLTNPSFLQKVNIRSRYVNRETGPYALFQALDRTMNQGKEVHILPYDSLYPIWVNNTAYRKANKNTCLLDPCTPESKQRSASQKQTTLSVSKRACLALPCEQYPKSLGIYHSGLGGTWSW